MFSINWEPKRGKGVFVRSIPQGSRVLDVGCGNNSPRWFRQVRPDIYYIGIDVGDYGQQDDPRDYANEYIITEPELFAEGIAAYANSMDAVICSHNLEHCNDPHAVLIAMTQALRPGGRLYLAFPCEESVGFPKRGGCLNFHDDRSHREVPNWNATLRALRDMDCDFLFVKKRYRPFPLFLRGLLMEPVSYWRRHVAPHGATWALYGFESVIWARRKSCVFVKDWGVRATYAGIGVNVQPDGSSAIWIQLEDFIPSGDVFVEFNGLGRGIATFSGGLLTAGIPSSVISTAGKYGVEVTDESGDRIPVGCFDVYPWRREC